MGRDEDRSVLVRGGGESRAGAAMCCGEEVVVTSCRDEFCGPEKDVVVGDLGAPKAVMNDITLHRVSVPEGEGRPTRLTSGSCHLDYIQSLEAQKLKDFTLPVSVVEACRYKYVDEVAFHGIN